ncbi:hypothetical protein HPB50_003835 [Hyalomma asiaticum]|uniref:Uncharacterized protein n=1 Tax=Hyalomma asiaticum TaxID=266040 RepID=A0ACB7TC83_HYAAI|nr:hypothetical protein HPB50_003835 [Hyalomma asiaticum]
MKQARTAETGGGAVHTHLRGGLLRGTFWETPPGQLRGSEALKIEDVPFLPVPKPGHSGGTSSDALHGTSGKRVGCLAAGTFYRLPYRDGSSSAMQKVSGSVCDFERSLLKKQAISGRAKEALHC